MKKVILSVLIILVVFAALLFLGKNYIAKTAVTKGVMAVTGLKIDINDIKVGIINTFIDVDDMKLFNPPDFPEKVMVEMPDIYVDYELSSFLKRKAHLEEIRIDLKEFTVIKNKNGELNIDSLKVAKEEKKEPQKPEKKEKTEVKIDLLDLKIGKVSYMDFSRGEKPKVIEYNVNLHEQFHNITNLNELGKIILVKALMKTDIAQLAGFALDSLQSEISGIIGKTPIVGKPIQDVTEKAVDTLKETTEGIKKKLKLPFGKQD